MLDVRDWGRRDYAPALEEMRRLRRARRAGAIPDTLILVEHPAVITVGVEGDDVGAFPPDIPVVEVERGGKATYHGPGQLVGYPIVDLTARGQDVRRFVGDLERLLIRALAASGIAAGHVSGRRGVWIEGTRKIASIGIAVEEWVTFHGFALNVDPDLATFLRFRPCGFDGSVMTSMARELGRPVSLDLVRQPVREAWNTIFSARVARAGPEELSVPGAA